ncbi:hypothetical protein POM88_009169 [Heracleum sosnowskyi]|uniref:RRM domain-containing protein n=1 Tax=Heracleum sosnowskyi TaxID=360622 RepID=A0AAD8J8X5_9APIA|nr:hypothetical protein POM88_009169 [Heracleum sosnowskyi]
MGKHASQGGQLTNQGGKQFQISNSIGGNKDLVRVKGDSKWKRASIGEKILKDFIWANKEIVDKEVVNKFFLGNKQAITEALNQIHWRSIKNRNSTTEAHSTQSFKERAKKQTYVEVLKSAPSLTKQFRNKDEQEWTLVKSKKGKKTPRAEEANTIFLYGIPEGATAREIWNIFKVCGEMKDIILPRKKDKRNQRFGFVKTYSELEAGRIITNVKERGGIGEKIRMNINGKAGQERVLVVKEKSQFQSNKEKEKFESVVPDRVAHKGEDQKDSYLGTKMFDFMDAAIDDDVETGLMQTKKIFLPKNMGGLGLVPLQNFNRALLAKWVFKWYGEREKGWNSWLRNSYNCGKSGSLEICFDKKHPSGIIKDIVEVINSQSTKELFKSSQFEWKVNKGYAVLFWEDIWYQGKPLMTSFPRLFSLSLWKNTVLSMFLDIWECYDHTSLVFWKRELRAWELHQVECLNEIIKGVSLNSREDVLIWLPGKDKYTVKEGTSLMGFGNNAITDSWNFIWNLKIPPKVQIFMWKLHHGILHVKAFLKSRMRNSQASSNCCRCSDTETVLHLFWQCSFAFDIWKWLFEWWGLPSIRIGSDIPTMWDSYRCFRDRITQEVWKTTLGACVWTIWLERNQGVFNNKFASLENVSFLILHRSAQWCLAAGFLVKETLAWWNINPMGCITRSIALKKMDLLNNGCALTGFIDGSWKLDNKGELVAGIGGLVLNTEGKKKLEFAGPIRTLDALHAEWKALFFIVDIISKKNLNTSWMIYSDSALLVRSLLTFKNRGNIEEELIIEVRKKILRHNIFIKQISRDFNDKEDLLAKLGSKFDDIKIQEAQDFV